MRPLDISEMPNPNYDEDQFSYPKSSPSSAGFGEVRSGTEFLLQYALGLFKLVFRIFWILANRVFVFPEDFVMERTAIICLRKLVSGTFFVNEIA